VLAQCILNDGGEVVADAEVTSVVIDLDARKTTPMPGVLAKQFDCSTSE
jgi:acyl-CoA thioesterase FadM